MTATTTESYYLHLDFEDIDLLTEAVREWDLDFLQLDSGRFRGKIDQARAGQVMIGHARFGRGLRQQGGTPSGTRSFVIPANPALQLHWRGKDVTGKDILAYPSGGDFESLSRPGFDMFTLTISEQLLSGIVTDAGLPGVDDLLGGEEVISCNQQAMSELRRQFSRIFRELEATPASVGHSGMQYKLNFELPRLLLANLAKSKPVIWRSSPHKRRQALKKAMAYVEAYPDQPITVRDLCRVADTSERTLQYAFQEHVGVTPKAFLQAKRLNGVRRMLRNAPSGTKVADAANRWGFWHMGQFAADYRKLFAELPSETLAKSSATLT